MYGITDKHHLTASEIILEQTFLQRQYCMTGHVNMEQDLSFTHEILRFNDLVLWSKMPDVFLRDTELYVEVKKASPLICSFRYSLTVIKWNYETVWVSNIWFSCHMIQQIKSTRTYSLLNNKILESIYKYF